MDYITSNFLKNLKTPAKDSHKGQNGKLTIVGGSHLFHGASLWALTVASRIVDMVYYVSTEENERLVEDLKRDLYAFIAVPQGKESEYIDQSDAVLIGPGMVRGSKEYTGTEEDGNQTKEKTVALLRQFPDKKWVIDAGALQAITPEDLLPLKDVIITPHQKEFENLFKLKTQSSKVKTISQNLKVEEIVEFVKQQARNYNCTILLKGQTDIIVSPTGEVLFNQTGNEGMTKGGTGDVLAGLIAALATTNDSLVAAAVGAYINGLAGDWLYQKVGPYFNADDLAKLVPEVLWEEINNSS
jgi:ADP-dependent NAD(P)H-hydrate dehydratase / NAD(P)H-hydrate epimerase